MSKRQIWFVDDDQDNRDQFVEQFGDLYRVRVFESAFDAYRESGSPDVFLIDCSSVGSFSMVHAMYAPICSLISKWPSTRYLVQSAMPIEFTENVVADVRRECPGVRIRAVEWKDDGLARFLN